MASSKITPVHKSIEEVFQSGPYRIDFYQRDYTWEEGEVEQLLDDIFDRFRVTDDKENPYYLNTLVIHKEGQDEYLVDGQQRVSTLLLILLVLHRILGEITDDDLKGKRKYLENFIFVLTPEGKKVFRIIHDKLDSNRPKGEFGPHQQTLQELRNGLSPKLEGRGISSKRLAENYQIIYNYLSEKFKKDGNSPWDKALVEKFGDYFLNDVSLTKIEVEFDEVPMLFEVINDRGRGLARHEILKGKLLGKIEDDGERLKYLEIWNDCISYLKQAKRPGKGKISPIFRGDPETFLKRLFAGRYVDSEQQYTNRLGKDSTPYDREFLIREDRKNDPNLPYRPDQYLITGPEEIRDFREEDLQFYTKLLRYVARKHKNFPFLNPETELSWNLLFGSIHSRNYVPAVFPYDPNSDDSSDKLKDICTRIRALSFEEKRLRSIVSLQEGMQSNNDINESIYSITSQIRKKEGKWKPQDLREIFDNAIFKVIEDRNLEGKGLALTPERFSAESPPSLFKDVEFFLSAQTGLETRARERNLQLEHIIGLNNTHYEDEFGDALYDHRDHLGCKLLLTANINNLLGNKSYEDKLNGKDSDDKISYRDSGFIWAASLSRQYHQDRKNQPALKKFKESFSFDLKSYDKLGKANIDDKTTNIDDFKRERKALLYKIAEKMWIGNTLDDEGYPEIAIYPGHPGSKQNPTK
ncbi:MAG: DUF262 domain-containing protein [Cytophagales bacterium]|nr:DUF262 domain-containing protein [Cytophagales bacterium]